jgi:hypothetical protein
MMSKSTAVREMALEVHVSTEILDYYLFIRLHKSRTEKTIHPLVQDGDQTVVQETVVVTYYKPITPFRYAADLCLITMKLSRLT